MELLYCGQEGWLCLKGNVSSVSDTSFSAKFTLSSKRPAQYSITQRINELYSAELKYGNNCWSAEARTAWLSGDDLALRLKRRGREKGGLFFSLCSSGKTEWEWSERIFLVLYGALT